MVFGPAMPLVDLSAYGAPGCSLGPTPNQLAFLLTDSVGQASLPLTLPNDPSLLGQQHSAQFVIFDGAANASGLVTSDTIDMLFGG